MPPSVGKLNQLKQMVFGKSILLSPFGHNWSFFSFSIYLLTFSCLSILDNNKFTGEWPKSVGNLSKLEFLSFCKCDDSSITRFEYLLESHPALIFCLQTGLLIFSGKPFAR